MFAGERAEVAGGWGWERQQGAERVALHQGILAAGCCNTNRLVIFRYKYRMMKLDLNLNIECTWVRGEGSRWSPWWEGVRAARGVRLGLATADQPARSPAAAALGPLAEKSANNNDD
jgi:hypothetical protein